MSDEESPSIQINHDNVIMQNLSFIFAPYPIKHDWFSLFILLNFHSLLGRFRSKRPMGEMNPWETLFPCHSDKHQRGYLENHQIEKIHLLLDYTFGVLNLHRVAVGIVGFIEWANYIDESVGFKREGSQRDGDYFNVGYHDFVMMSILEDESRDL